MSNHIIILVLMVIKKDAVDRQLHMTVKELGILQGEIICNLKELIKKARRLQEKEEEGEEANHLLEMISDNLNELGKLFEQRKKMRNRIENLEKTQMNLMKKKVKI